MISRMARFAVAHLDDVGEREDAGRHFRPIRLQLGITAFGATTWTAHAGGEQILNEHDPGDPTADQELFVVLRGHATFQLDGTSVDAPNGTFVFVPPGTTRSAVADEAETEILLIEGTPGKAYDARGWEIWAPLAPLYSSGRHGEVAERLGVEVEAHPQYGMLFFNLACCESLLGRTDDALQHLRRAIELSEEFREDAMHDADLAAIREESAFKQMIAD
jgi:hypothetical protein